MDNKLSYLRIILTEEENYPLVYKKRDRNTEIITQEKQSMKLEDFKSIIRFFAKRGLKKIRFTGGEPLLYKGLEELIKFSKEMQIPEISITTNGIGLATRIINLKECGLTGVNISLDSIKEYKYNALTNGANLKEVFLSIDACKSAGVNITINCVAIKDFNDDELIDFMKMTISNEIDVRLIELLPFNIDKNVFERGFIDLKEYIRNTEAIHKTDDEDLSIAEFFKIDNAKGRVGIITKTSREYKEDMRRVNVTNRGYMNVGALQDNTYYIKNIINNYEKLDDLFYKISSNVN